MDQRLRLQGIREGLRESLWFPAAGTVAVGLGVGDVLGRSAIGGGVLDPVTFSSDVSGARTVLVSLLGALITAISIVFSLTLVALQTVGTNYSPRLLRNFKRDQVTQVVLAILLGTASYTLAALHAIRGDTVPRLGVTIALLLALISVLAIAYFINHIAQSLRVEAIMHSVAQETTRAIDRAFGEHAEGADDDPRRQLPALPRDAEIVGARDHGYLQQVDTPALVRIATDFQVTIRLQPQRGQYVVPGTPLAWVWAGEGGRRQRAGHDDLDGRIRDAVGIGLERTLQQDVAFGFRQIVDVAIKAISPAVNDPYTAVQGLDHLNLLLGRLAGHRLGPQLAYGDDDRLLVAVPAAGFGDYLGLACDQIRRYGAREPAVTLRLVLLLRDLAIIAPPCHRGLLATQLDAVLDGAERESGTDPNFGAVQAAAKQARLWLAGDIEPAPQGSALDL